MPVGSHLAKYSACYRPHRKTRSLLFFFFSLLSISLTSDIFQYSLREKVLSRYAEANSPLIGEVATQCHHEVSGVLVEDAVINICFMGIHFPTSCIKQTELRVEANFEAEVLESSQIDVENLVIETPTASSLLRAQDKECQDSDGEDRSVTDEADGNYQENIVSSKPLIVLKTSRVLRSNAVKHEPMQPGSPTSSQIETPNLAKRGREKHDDVATRPEKRVKKPAVDAKIEKYEKAFDEWLEDYKSKTQGLETFKTKNQELCMENNTLKKGLKKAQQDQKRMEALHSSEISLLQSECSKLRKKLEAAIDASKQDNLKYTKVSDSDITAEWGKLSFNIRDLVSQCLTKHPANENDEIETLMKRMKRFLPLSNCNVASLRAAVLRRMIWYIIKSAVFSGMRPIWYGAAGQMLTQVVYMAST